MKPIYYCGIALVTAAAVLLAARDRKSQYSMTLGGFGASSDGWHISAGAVRIANDKPGVVFATDKGPSTSRQLSYVVFVRHPELVPGAGLSESKANGTIKEGYVGFMQTGLSMAGSELDLVLTTKADQISQKFKAENFKINGQETDLSKGKVFMADFKAKPLTVKQIDVPLSIELPETIEMKDIEGLADRLVKDARNSSPDVRSFLKE